MTSESSLVGHEPCPECGSKDNLARYDDGHGYCFGCGHYEHGEDSTPTTRRTKVSQDIIDSSPITRTIRGISPETFKLWRYEEGTFKGQPVHVANHLKDGKVVGQKIRTRDKKFLITGTLEPLYGMNLWGKGKKIVVTEGELDALSVSQANRNKWPVVSVANGAQGASKCVAKALRYLDEFEQVIFMFDQDEPGQKAALECARLLKPGKAAIATLPAKDANELLQAGKADKIVTAIFSAKPYRPEGIIALSDVIEDAMKPPEVGISLPWKPMTNMTYGIRLGEWTCIGAGVGVGKTDFMATIAAHLVKDHGETIGYLALEQPTRETAVRLAGKVDDKLYHIPDAEYEPDHLRNTLNTLGDKVYLFDHFGQTDWDSIAELLRYLRHSCGVRYFFLDHLTALASHADDERRHLDRVCAELSGLCQELQMAGWVVSHLTTPKSGSHEEAARVYENQLTGSRAIARWAHFIFGLERNKQAEDEAERHTTTVRCLKDRYSGQGTGKTFKVKYDTKTGRLEDVTPEAELFDIEVPF